MPAYTKPAERKPAERTDSSPSAAGSVGHLLSGRKSTSGGNNPETRAPPEAREKLAHAAGRHGISWRRRRKSSAAHSAGSHSYSERSYFSSVHVVCSAAAVRRERSAGRGGEGRLRSDLMEEAEGNVSWPEGQISICLHPMAFPGLKGLLSGSE